MKKIAKSNHMRITILLAAFSLLTACGGGGSGGSADDPAVSNPVFLTKAEAVDFSRIRLYEGHVNEGDKIFSELDVSNLSSGDLITVDVEFEITGDLDDYALLVQLVPQSIYSQFNQGSTIGEIINANAQQDEDFIDLGGAYIDEVQPGLLHGVVHAKLPNLSQDATYRILVTPSLGFLSSGKAINNNDVETVPVLFDNRELVISKLEVVSAKIASVPNPVIDNEFTQLEIGGLFDENDHSVEPVFQTSIEIDVTSFNETEIIALSLTYEDPSGSPVAMGLLSSGIIGVNGVVIMNGIVSMNGFYEITQKSETSITIPVVAYATLQSQAAMLAQATNITDIADQLVSSGDFKLKVFRVENGVNIDTGQAHLFSIPLVSQDNRALVFTSDNVINFSVLRAGPTNSACLLITPAAFDIDTGIMGPGSHDILASACPASPGDAYLWRYDFATKQFISKEVDDDGDSHCITAIDEPVVTQGLLQQSNIRTLLLGTFTDVEAAKCEFQTVGFGVPAGTAVETQMFGFEGNKIRFLPQSRYLNVSAINTANVDVDIISLSDPELALDFFSSANGVDIDQYGRLFYIGKFYDRGWGSDELARVNLSYGGESFLDYLPVLGTTTQGHLTLSASLFGDSVDLMDVNFAHKRYLSKQISSVTGNIYPVNVGNGAEFSVDVAGFTAQKFGGITTRTVTESFNPLDNIRTRLNQEPVNEVVDASYKRTIDETFVDYTVAVFAIPVSIKGGITGDLDFRAQLSSQGIGVDGVISELMSLNGFLEATAAFVAGVDGEIEIINQRLDYSAGGKFEATTDLPPELTFNINSSLDASLSLIKANVTAFLNYPSPCWCVPPYKIKKKETLLYSSPYLFDDQWSAYTSGTKTFSAIPY